MRVTHRLWGALAALLFIAGQAAAMPVLPEGTAITGQPGSLLGYSSGLNDYVSGGVSSVSDANIEFLTADFALALDFTSDGRLRLWDNLGTGEDDFNFTLRFAFADLAGALIDIGRADVRNLIRGDLSVSILDRNTFELTLHDVRFEPGFTSLDLSITVAEPPALALLALGLIGLLATVARRRVPARTRHGVSS